VYGWWHTYNGLVNKFVVLRHPAGKLEIVELEIGNDPIDVATSRHAYLIGITQSRERAEVLLTRETKQVALRA
jgi:hypothetical protein